MSVERADEVTRSALANRLASVFASRALERTGGRRAAVAIVIGYDHGTLGFMLTQRASRLAAHSGQYALPGGRMEEGENPVDAALRELREELGLALVPDDVIGRLPDYRTGSGFRITPIAAWADDVSAVEPNPDEVAVAYHIPLSALRGPATPTLLRVAGEPKPVIQMPLGGDRVIHAPTGAILHQFAAAALEGRYVDAESFEEPVWARA